MDGTFSETNRRVYWGDSAKRAKAKSLHSRPVKSTHNLYLGNIRDFPSPSRAIRLFPCLFSSLASRRRYDTEQDGGSASQLTLANHELSSEECEICLIPFDKEDHVKVIPRDCVSKLFGSLAGEVPLLQAIEPLVW